MNRKIIFDNSSFNIMTVTETAQYLNLTRIAVLKAIDRNSLPATKIGNQYVITEEAVEYYKKHRLGRVGKPKKVIS